MNRETIKSRTLIIEREIAVIKEYEHWELDMSNWLKKGGNGPKKKNILIVIYYFLTFS